jgi:hypothetical protein
MYVDFENFVKIIKSIIVYYYPVCVLMCVCRLQFVLNSLPYITFIRFITCMSFDVLHHIQVGLSVCGKEFSMNFSLQRHIRTHTGDNLINVMYVAIFYFFLCSVNKEFLEYIIMYLFNLMFKVYNNVTCMSFDVLHHIQVGLSPVCVLMCLSR